MCYEGTGVLYTLTEYFYEPVCTVEWGSWFLPGLHDPDIQQEQKEWERSSACTHKHTHASTYMQLITCVCLFQIMFCPFVCVALMWKVNWINFSCTLYYSDSLSKNSLSFTFSVAFKANCYSDIIMTNFLQQNSPADPIPSAVAYIWWPFRKWAELSTFALTEGVENFWAKI